MFVSPENKNSEDCLEKGHWQYDYTKYLTLGSDNSLEFDKTNTTQLIQALLSNNKTGLLAI